MGIEMEAGSADEIRGGQSAMGQSGSCNTRYPQSSWVLEELYWSSMQLQLWYYIIYSSSAYTSYSITT